MAGSFGVTHPLPFMEAKGRLAGAHGFGLGIPFEQPGGGIESAVVEEFGGSAKVALEQEAAQVEGLDDLGAGLDHAIHAHAAGEINLVHLLIERGERGPGAHLLGAAGGVDDEALARLELLARRSEEHTSEL